MRQDWKVVFQMSAHQALTAPLVVPVSSRWDLRMRALHVSTVSTGFTVKTGWNGEGGMAEGQQRGLRMKIRKFEGEVEEAA